MSGYIGEQRQVYVIDSLTRSQIENAEFDFNNMPTVGGDPVVQNGSNSDGQWTQFADGTMVVRRGATVNLTANGNQTITMPLSFVSPYVAVGGGSDNSNGTGGISTSDYNALKSSHISKAAGDAWLFNCDADAGANSAFIMTLFAIGYWK